MKTIKLPFKVKEPVLACGADLKGAFALAKGDIAYLYDGFGDLSELDNYTKYVNSTTAALKKHAISPKVVVCDLHPGYYSTRFAETFKLSTVDCRLWTIQHHEAHIASVITDNAIKDDILGAAFDGTGYGSDGNMWGGEFFEGSIRKLKRVSHLDYIPMPGGEACVKEPWRMAASYLYYTFGKSFLKLRVPFIKDIDKSRWSILQGMIDKKINSPGTSSMGRFFDAAASFVMNKKKVAFEAELPIEFERMARAGIDLSYDSDSSTSIMRGLARDVEKRTEAAVISAKFHNSIANLILNVAGKRKMKKIVLSGGVFQNNYLLKRATQLLTENGFNVFTHSAVQTNDSGIPIGQIAIVNERVLCA